MRTLGAYEAKTHLSRLLDEVEAGESYAITKHGRPIALLTPVGRGGHDLPVDRAIVRVKQFRKGRRLGGISIPDLIQDGRRR